MARASAGEDQASARALAYASAHRAEAVAALADMVRFPSVSADPRRRAGLRACAAWLAEHLSAAGLDNARLIPTAGHPVVYADWLGAPGRPTLLIYGHYDVQPEDPLDKWHSPPFEPTVRGDNIHGRGASDDKGQLLAHVKAVEAYLRATGRFRRTCAASSKARRRSAARACPPSSSARRALRRRCRRDLRHADARTRTGPRSPNRCEARSASSWRCGARSAICTRASTAAPFTIRSRRSVRSSPSCTTRPGASPSPASTIASGTGASRSAPTWPRWGRRTPRSFTPPPPAAAGARRATPSTSARRSGPRSRQRAYRRLSGPGRQGGHPGAGLAKLNLRLAPDQDPDEVERLLRAQIARLTPPTVRSTLRTQLAARPATVHAATPPSGRRPSRTGTASASRPASSASAAPSRRWTSCAGGFASRRCSWDSPSRTTACTDRTRSSTCRHSSEASPPASRSLPSSRGPCGRWQHDRRLPLPRGQGRRASPGPGTPPRRRAPTCRGAPPRPASTARSSSRPSTRTTPSANREVARIVASRPGPLHGFAFVHADRAIAGRIARAGADGGRARTASSASSCTGTTPGSRARSARSRAASPCPCSTIPWAR